jgi:hypothetical protein
MKLLREVTESVEHIIEEGAEGVSKRHFIQGTFMEEGIKNRNGRIYEHDTLFPEVERFNKEIVKENRGFGELGHPAGPTINLDRVCTLIKEISHNSNGQYRGKAQIMETPMGQIVKGLLEGGAKLGVSSRALGSLKPGNDGAMIVQPDLRLITVDVVADPSAPNAFVEGIMENAEWVQDESGGWKVLEVVEDTKKKIKKLDMRQINEQKVRLFEEAMAKIAAKRL